MPTETKNRKARRAEAKEKGEPFQPLSSSADIPLSQPDRTGPKGKTLLEIAEERNALLQKGQPFSPVHGDGLVRDEQGRVILPTKDVSANPPDSSRQDGGSGSSNWRAMWEEYEVEYGEDTPLGAAGDALFLTATLSMLHFTISVLVENQYSSHPPELLPLFWRTLSVAPLLSVLVFMFKVPAVARWRTSKQAVHLLLGVAAGCYLIRIGNQGSYLAVMERAPPVGAVWVWNVVEMKLKWAVAHLVVCAAFVLWNGYSLM